MAKGRAKKAILITTIVLVILVGVIIAFISPIAKYLVEKYDVKYLGREIKIGWLYLNPFTGYIHIGNLKIYEANSDSLFLTADGLSANFEMFKMLSKTYEIGSISLDKPVGYIIQNKKRLNFSDIIERFTPKTKKDTSIHKEPVHFNILDIAVKDGEFHYIEQTIPVNYYVKKVNIESTGKWWNVDSMKIKFALESGPDSGSIKGTGALYFDSAQYSVSTQITRFNLNLINQYLKDLANYGHLEAMLDADVKAKGSFKTILNLQASGFAAVSDFHFGKTRGDDFASCERIVLDATEINPKNFKYLIDSVMLGHPYFKYERYDHLNNIERMFGKNGSKIKQAKAESDAGQFNLIIEIAKAIKKIGQNFLKSYYKVGKIAVYNGDVRFSDFSLREKFSVDASPLNLIADSIDKANRRFAAVLTTAIKPYGDINAKLSLDPNNYGNFDLQYKLVNLPISMFNPYVVSYTSFPLDRGKLEFTGFMSVVDSVILSENHLLIVDPRSAKRIKKKDTKWIPIPLILSLVRSTGNAIDFQIPIRGNLGNPKFKIWGAVWQIVANIFIKPPSTGYLVHVSNVEQEVEKSLTLKWIMRQSELRPSQEKFVKRMANFLKENKDAVITVSPMEYAVKEKENILLFEAKKKYFLETHKILSKNLSEDDSLIIDKMSVKDSFFIHYLDKLVGDTMMFTLQEKCDYIIGKPFVEARFAELLKSRKQVFKSYFGEEVSRLKFKPEQNTVPFNGFSYYKIDYKGEIPESLVKAYEELQDLNDESPRKKYKANRLFRHGLITEEREAKRKTTTP